MSQPLDAAGEPIKDRHRELELELALPDPDKLDKLAEVFDGWEAFPERATPFFEKSMGTEVQDDLRKWAKAIRMARA